MARPHLALSRQRERALGFLRIDWRALPDPRRAVPIRAPIGAVARGMRAELRDRPRCRAQSINSFAYCTRRSIRSGSSLGEGRDGAPAARRRCCSAGAGFAKVPKSRTRPIGA
ncbi:hypothetical protein [Lysobacter gummosus]|uniref:hypothetical protein n=1 Tax=Lysobacter gummosus TaxID=262324 RepID=UPI0036305BFC